MDMKFKTILESKDGVFLGDAEYPANAEEVVLIVTVGDQELKVTLSAKVEPLE